GLQDGVRGLRLAFAETVFWDQADPEVAQAVRACGEVFAALGAVVDSVAFPEAAEAQELHPRGLVVAAEAYTIHQARLEAHFEHSDPIVRQRLPQGSHVAPTESPNTPRAGTQLRAKALQALRHVDVLLAPTTIIPPLPVLEIDASLEAYSAGNQQYLRNTAIG